MLNEHRARAQSPPFPLQALAPADALAEIGRLSAVPTLLAVLADSSGMGFAAVLRASGSGPTACAVHDAAGFGVQVGTRLPIFTNSAEFPIVLADGTGFGSLCCAGHGPGAIDEPQTRAMLQRFAELIAAQLDEERARVEQLDQLANERAAGVMREQFIAILGHDLRGPLSAVSAGAELLKRRVYDSATDKLLELMLNNVKRMRALIDDTLDFARGRMAGGLSLHIDWSSGVGAAIEEVADALRLVHPTRSIGTQISMQRAVYCDVARLQQLVSNLLGNAIVHGAPRTEIVVRASCDAEALELTVSNFGEPIAPAALGKIFEPFWRPLASHGPEGLGLGLHICSEIVRAHGGTLTVASTAREGTTFVARLPLGGPAASTAAPVQLTGRP